MTAVSIKNERRIDPVIQLKPYFPAYFVIGKKGAGKSALLERMLEIYYKLSYVILDWNGAFDLEGFQWCVKGEDRRRPDGVIEPGAAYPILVIIPRTTELVNYGNKLVTKEGEIDAVKIVYDDTPLKDIIKMCYTEKRICIFNIYLYREPSKGQRKLAEFINELPIVMRDEMPAYVNCALGLRELADLSSNRMKAHKGGGETESKRSLNTFSRMARHARVTMIVDMQNPDDVYGQLVAQEDFILAKRLNKHHIPEKLSWLQKTIDAKIDSASNHYMRNKVKLVSLDRLSTNSYYCIWPDGHYTIQHNSEPGFRHHKVDDDAQLLAGVKIRFPTKQEMVQSVEGKIMEIQQKKTAKEERIAMLQEALDHYSKKKADDPAYSWHDCAKDIKFMGIDGKPSGEGLMKAVKRGINDGVIKPKEGNNG